MTSVLLSDHFEKFVLGKQWNWIHVIPGWLLDGYYNWNF